MIGDDVIYRGNVNIYLQGHDALMPVNIHSKLMMSYWIGAPYSTIFINDFRPEPNLAAQRVLKGEIEFDFAEVFNQPAWAEISINEDAVEITLEDRPSDGDFPILWLGILDDNTMPIHDIDWEILKPLDQNRTAFAAIVR